MRRTRRPSGKVTSRFAKALVSSSSHTLTTSALMLAAMGAWPSRAEASEAGLAEAKALYAAAAYAEALAAVSDADTAEAHEYRALCLLALGRQDEAEQAAEAMVRTDPRYSLPTEERPPRFVKLVAASSDFFSPL